MAASKEDPVPIYQAHEYDQIKSLPSKTHTYVSEMLRSPMKPKIFSLLPFYAEAAFTSKHFVSKMSVLPESGQLHMEILTMEGLESQYVPVSHIVPITKYDYWGASWKLWSKQNTCLDLDMIYANRITKEMYLFDKAGDWHAEGVDHESVSLDKTYNERHWYDQFYVNSM